MPPDDLARARERMVARQLRARGIEDEEVLRGLGRVQRELFVPEGERRKAYEDAALPIGHDQTISQPYMVAVIVEALAVRPAQRVLDVGAGSGYQAAVLAELGAEVVAIERIPELAEQARANLAATGYERVDVVVGDGTLGWAERAPYDGIAVAAAAPALPQTLYEQLRPGGRLVVPVGGPRAQRLEVIVRSPEGPALRHSVPCRFVPLVGAEGYAE
jgi:protein-L-isoaspartate(D-aspartate) O-methyltransferase